MREGEAHDGKGRAIRDGSEGRCYCQVTLDSGEKLLVSHDRGGFGGGTVTVQEVRWWGIAAGDILLRCDLERDEGRRLLARLVHGAPPTSARATPLGAFVEQIKECRSLGEAKAKCMALVSSEPEPAG